MKHMESKLIFVSVLGGFAAKLYDDLKDNNFLMKFKNKLFMEFLKGLHFICFTVLSLKEPLFFIFNYIADVLNALGDLKAYSKPYEKSLPYSFFLLFFLIDYKKLERLTSIDIFVTSFSIALMFLEPLFVKSEYSYFKLFYRTSCLLSSFFILVLPISPYLKYTYIYSIGYFLCSSIVQCYSLFCRDIVKCKVNKRKKSRFHKSNEVK